jgi:hypothetical protein
MNSVANAEATVVARAPAHVRMVEMPEPKGVNPPKARSQTDVTLEDEDVHRSVMLTLDAVRGRSDYIDNWIGTADIEVELLSIAPTTMTLKFAQGQSVTFSVADIVTGPAVPAMVYRKKNGVISQSTPAGLSSSMVRTRRT